MLPFPMIRLVSSAIKKRDSGIKENLLNKIIKEISHPDNDNVNHTVSHNANHTVSHNANHTISDNANHTVNDGSYYKIVYNEVYVYENGQTEIRNNGRPKTYNDYRVNIDIADLIFSRGFCSLLTEIKKYMKGMHDKYENIYECNINNNKNQVKSIKCKKFKALLIFLINFLITNELYEILINTLGETILQNFLLYEKSNTLLNQMKKFLTKHTLLRNPIEYTDVRKVLKNLKLFEIDETNNILTVNFQSITKFIHYGLTRFLKEYNSSMHNECNSCINNKNPNTTKDKTELFKVNFLVTIIILYFNHIYDNRENFTKISKKTFNDIKGWIMFIRYLPSCVQPGILKEECIKLVKDPTFKDFMGFTDIRKLLYFLPAFYTSCKKNKSTVNKIVNEFTTIKNKIWRSIGAQK
jgi:hypothetical protein